MKVGVIKKCKQLYLTAAFLILSGYIPIFVYAQSLNSFEGWEGVSAVGNRVTNESVNSSSVSGYAQVKPSKLSQNTGTKGRPYSFLNKQKQSEKTNKNIEQSSADQATEVVAQNLPSNGYKSQREGNVTEINELPIIRSTNNTPSQPQQSSSFPRTTSLIQSPQNINVARYGLRDIIKQTVSFHPTISGAFAAYKRSEIAVKIARAGWQPNVDLTMSHNFKRELNLSPNQSNPTNEVRNSIDLRVVQSLNWIEQSLAVKSAKNIAEADKERYFDTQDQLALQSALSYIQIFRFYNRFEIGIDYRNLLRRINQKVTARAQSGYTSALESKKLMVIEARIQAENEFNRRQFETAQLFLSNISGIPNLNVRALKGFNFKVPNFVLGEKEIINKAIGENRGLMAVRKEIEISEKNWKKEMRKIYPSFNIDGGYKWQDYVSSDRSGLFADKAITLNMSYKLWDGGAKYKRMAAAKWGLEESIRSYEAQKLQVINEIQTAFTGLNVSLTEFKHAENARNQAIDLINLQEKDFNSGSGTSLLDLINSTQEWYTSATDEIDAYYEMMSRYMQLKRLIGEMLDSQI